MCDSIVGGEQRESEIKRFIVVGLLDAEVEKGVIMLQSNRITLNGKCKAERECAKIKAERERVNLAEFVIQLAA